MVSVGLCGEAWGESNKNKKTVVLTHILQKQTSSPKSQSTELGDLLLTTGKWICLLAVGSRNKTTFIYTLL